MLRFTEIFPTVLEKIFVRFLPYMGMAAILVMSAGLFSQWLPIPTDASHKIWLLLAKRFQRCLDIIVILHQGGGR